MSDLLHVLVPGITIGAGFALLALGIVIVYRVTDVKNMAHGVPVVAGGMLVARLLTGFELNYVVSILVSVAVVAVLSAAAGFVIMGSRRNTRPLDFLMTSLGMAIVLEGVILLAFGDRPISYDSPAGTTALFMWGVAVRPGEIVLLVTAVLLIVLVWLTLDGTYFGKAMQACAAHREAARACGIPVRAMGMLAFAVAGSLAAVAGALMMPLMSMSHYSVIPVAIQGVIAAVLGGLGSIRGSLAGGILLGVCFSAVAWWGNPAYQSAIGLVVLLGVLLVKQSRLPSMLARA